MDILVSHREVPIYSILIVVNERTLILTYRPLFPPSIRINSDVSENTEKLKSGYRYLMEKFLLKPFSGILTFSRSLYDLSLLVSGPDSRLMESWKSFIYPNLLDRIFFHRNELRSFQFIFSPFSTSLSYLRQPVLFPSSKSVQYNGIGITPPNF